MNRRPARVFGLMVALALTPVMPLAACSSEADVATAPGSIPADGSVEAGFARDMSAHHAQAVAMAEAVRFRTADADLALLAADIALGQQNQIGRMTGWLDLWGLRVGSTRPRMAWMVGHARDDMHGADPAAAATAVMPGMATRPQITSLGTLPVDEAEIHFLQLMMAHHRGGVEMASAALGLTSDAVVIRLARSIVESQQAEIVVMAEMLAKRGVTS